MYTMTNMEPAMCPMEHCKKDVARDIKQPTRTAPGTQGEATRAIPHGIPLAPKGIRKGRDVAFYPRLNLPHEETLAAGEIPFSIVTTWRQGKKKECKRVQCNPVKYADFVLDIKHITKVVEPSDDLDETKSHKYNHTIPRVEYHIPLTRAVRRKGSDPTYDKEITVVHDKNSPRYGSMRMTHYHGHENITDPRYPLPETISAMEGYLGGHEHDAALTLAKSVAKKDKMGQNITLTVNDILDNFTSSSTGTQTTALPKRSGDHAVNRYREVVPRAPDGPPVQKPYDYPFDPEDTHAEWESTANMSVAQRRILREGYDQALRDSILCDRTLTKKEMLKIPLEANPAYVETLTREALEDVEPHQPAYRKEFPTIIGRSDMEYDDKLKTTQSEEMLAITENNEDKDKALVKKSSSEEFNDSEDSELEESSEGEEDSSDVQSDSEEYEDLESDDICSPATTLPEDSDNHPANHIYWISCKKCGEEFAASDLRVPRYLPCLHIFCTECIDKAIEAAIKCVLKNRKKYVYDEKTEIKFDCPDCGICIPCPAIGADYFPVSNFTLNVISYIERCNKLNNLSCVYQTAHDIHASSDYYCEDCHVGVCTDCYMIKGHVHTGHSVMKWLEFLKREVRKQHIFNPAYLCDDHSLEEKYYCQYRECRLIVCGECRHMHNAFHPGYITQRHTFASYCKVLMGAYLDSIFPKAFKKIETMLDRCRIHRESVLERYLDAEDSVTATTWRAQGLVETLRKRLIDQLYGIQEELFRDWIFLIRHDFWLIQKTIFWHNMLQTELSLGYDGERPRLYDDIYPYIKAILWDLRWNRKMKQLPVFLDLGKRQSKLGIKINKTKLMQKYRALPWAVESIALRNDIVIAIHHTNTAASKSMQFILGKDRSMVTALRYKLHREAPRAFRISFIPGKEFVLGVVQRDDFTWMTKDTPCGKGKRVLLTKKDFINQTGKHDIRLINLTNKSVKINTQAQKYFSPTAIAGTPHGNFVFANGAHPLLKPSIYYVNDEEKVVSLFLGIHEHESKLFQPDYMCTNSKGQVIVTDRYFPRLIILNVYGDILAEFEDYMPHYHAMMPRQFYDVAVDEKDFIYLACSYKNQIIRLNPRGKFQDIYLSERDQIKDPISLDIEKGVLAVGSRDGTISLYDLDDPFTDKVIIREDPYTHETIFRHGQDDFQNLPYFVQPAFY